MQSSTSTCWKMSTHRGFAEQPPPSRAKMLNPGLRAESAIGSPTFASLPEVMLRGPVHKRACRHAIVASVNLAREKRMTTTEAMAFVREHGVVLASARGAVPRLTEVIVGEP